MIRIIISYLEESDISKPMEKEVKDYEAGNQNIEEGFYQKLKEETKELYKNLSK